MIKLFPQNVIARAVLKKPCHVVSISVLRQTAFVMAYLIRVVTTFSWHVGTHSKPRKATERVMTDNSSVLLCYASAPPAWGEYQTGGHCGYLMHHVLVVKCNSKPSQLTKGNSLSPNKNTDKITSMIRVTGIS